MMLQIPGLEHFRCEKGKGSGRWVCVCVCMRAQACGQGDSWQLTWVLESGLSQGRMPERRKSAIRALSLCASMMVRGMHSSVSSVA